MADDPPRSLPGQQSDPRPAAGAPAWWGALGRADLPLDSESAPIVGRSSGAPVMASRTAGRGRLSALRWKVWAFNLGVLALAVLIICVGIGVVSLSLFLTVALLFGVPLTLAALTSAIIARRSR